jgi:hypothetical protein
MRSRLRTTDACTSKWKSSAARRTRRVPRPGSTRWKRRRACSPTCTRSGAAMRRPSRRSRASARRT